MQLMAGKKQVVVLRMNAGKALFTCLIAGLGTISIAHAQNSADQTTLSSPSRSTPESFSELSKTLMPSVVNISTTQRVVEAGLPEVPPNSPMERFNEFFGRDDDGLRRTSSLGSGFVIDESGYIVTNNHVIEGADEIDVTFADGKTFPAVLIGRDPETDIAVLKIEAPFPLPAVKFADSDQIEVGDWVIAIGNPFGLGGSVSAGIVSARNRDINAGAYDDFIQTDAAINKGNSGGPLFNLKGEVVGVNTAIISPTGGSVGIGFSVSSNLAKSIVSQLIENGEVHRGYLGVNIQAVDAPIAKIYGLNAAAGVIVTKVTEDSPGDKAGLKEGDLILKYDGKTILDTRMLSRLVAETRIDSMVEVNIIREGKRQAIKVKIEEREDDIDGEVEDTPPPPLFVGANAYGLKLTSISEDARRRWQIPKPVKGALVEMVDPDGAAYGFLEKGDVIVEVNFKTVDTPEDADKQLDAVAGADPVLVKVYRRGRVSFHALQIEA